MKHVLCFLFLCSFSHGDYYTVHNVPSSSPDDALLLGTKPGGFNYLMVMKPDTTYIVGNGDSRGCYYTFVGYAHFLTPDKCYYIHVNQGYMVKLTSTYQSPEGGGIKTEYTHPTKGDIKENYGALGTLSDGTLIPCKASDDNRAWYPENGEIETRIEAFSYVVIVPKSPLLVSPLVVNTVAGDSLNLCCKFMVGDGRYSASWFKGSEDQSSYKLLFGDGKGTMAVEDPGDPDAECCMSFNSVEVGDGGEYRCYVDYPQFPVERLWSANITLTVTGPDCESGQFLNSDTDTCEDCPANTFTSSPNRDSSCTPCPDEMESPPGSTSNSDCVCVGASFKSSDGTACESCEVGYSLNDNACVACDAGLYRSSELESCQMCPDNHYSGEAAGTCLPCPSHSLVNSMRTGCESCIGLATEWSYVKSAASFPVRPGAEVVLTCEPGYSLTGDSVVTCTKDRLYNFANEPACERDTCSQLPDIANLVSDTVFPVYQGQLVTVSCAAGFSLHGSSLVTCVKDSTFSYAEELTECLRNTCSGIPEDISCLVSDASFPVDYGTTVNVYCDPSCNMELRGDDTMTCEKGTTFSYSDKPKCNPINTCTELPIEKNLKTQAVFPINNGEIVYVACNDGYSMTSGQGTATCIMDSTFNYKEEPVCEIDKCDGMPVDIPNIVPGDEVEFPVLYDEVIRITCLKGYSIHGSNLMTCKSGADFQYETSPECKLDNCIGLPDLANMATAIAFPVIVGTEIEIRCENGYTHSGSSVLTCVKEYEFQMDQYPNCRKDYCKGPFVEDNLVLSGNIVFPVEFSTELTVTCTEGLTLIGSSVITCTKDYDYNYIMRPTCVNPGDQPTTFTSIPPYSCTSSLANPPMGSGLRTLWLRTLVGIGLYALESSTIESYTPSNIFSTTRTRRYLPIYDMSLIHEQYGRHL